LVQQLQYQFKHIKLSGGLSENELALASEAAEGWDVVGMTIDRRYSSGTIAQEQIEIIYLLRKQS
jgi:hypothetical protein